MRREIAGCFPTDEAATVAAQVLGAALPWRVAMVWQSEEAVWVVSYEAPDWWFAGLALARQRLREGRSLDGAEVLGEVVG
jgi:hypothetical protein